MKADWDKLADGYAKSDSVLIVDVDCTADGQSTCSAHGVKGYPSIKYFMAGSKKGQDYSGGRDFAALSTFVKTTLDKGSSCDVVTLKGCQPIEKKFIEENSGKSASELAELRKQKDSEHKEEKKTFETAKAGFAEAEKTFKKEQKKNAMATNILKQLEKNAGKKGKKKDL